MLPSAHRFSSQYGVCAQSHTQPSKRCSASGATSAIMRAFLGNTLIYFKGNATVKIALQKASTHKMGIDTPYSTQISYHKIRKKSSKAFRPIRSESRDSVILTNCLFSKNQRFYIIFSLSVCNVNHIYHNYVLKHRFCLILELNTPFLSLPTNIRTRR